jgi:hypothetical protein
MLTDRLLRPLEALLVETGRLANRFPPTFVIGAPRCGTTLVGLHLVHSFRFAYFPNVAKQHPRTPFVHTWLAVRRRTAYEPSYQSAYGHVEGPLAPSDGWDILRRWFPIYRETPPPGPGLRTLKNLVRRFEDLYGGPFLCKNNHNSTRIHALNALFPDCLFVAVRRGLPEAVHSLLEARERHGIALGQWWSAAPPEHLGRRFDSELRQAVVTIVGLERHAERELARCAPDRSTIVGYEEFCARPESLLEWLRGAYARRGIELEPRGVSPTSFRASRLPAGKRQALLRAIESLRASL